MRRMVAPTVHFTVVKRPVAPRRPLVERRRVEHANFDRFSDDRFNAVRLDAARPSRDGCDEQSPVGDLLPWADPYIAMLAARLEAQGRAEQEEAELDAPRIRLAR